MPAYGYAVDGWGGGRGGFGAARLALLRFVGLVVVVAAVVGVSAATVVSAAVVVVAAAVEDVDTGADGDCVASEAEMIGADEAAAALPS